MVNVCIQKDLFPAGESLFEILTMRMALVHWREVNAQAAKADTSNAGAASQPIDAFLCSADFAEKHAYMGQEELELHHKRYEVEPYFRSKAEKEDWKWQKKIQKFKTYKGKPAAALDSSLLAKNGGSKTKGENFHQGNLI